MYEVDRAEGVASEAAILVGVLLTDGRDRGEPLDELNQLAKTVGARVVGKLTQRRETPDQATYLGRGKVEELRRQVQAAEADVCIFDNDLSPAQTRNLEQATKVKVLDRTELILDIFASRARTHQARLAVELAQLEYSLPRLKRMWTHLSRIKNGIGMRGPGEKQLEVDRRLVERRVSDLRKQLQAIERRRAREVASRRDFLTVSLVGYTNAGKSTLLNRLTGADVVARDALFATLDTRTRRWQLPGWGPVLLSDTVGFIRDLPHHLISSFKATLEEARQTDLMLHVADASSPAAFDQIAAVYRVLEELEIEEKSTLLVLNKVDRIVDPAKLHRLRDRYPHAIAISAHTGEGISRLATAVSDALSRSFLDVDVEMGVDNGRVMAYLAASGEVLSRRYHNSRVTVHCRIPEQYIGRLKEESNIELRSHATNGSMTEKDQRDAADAHSDVA